MCYVIFYDEYAYPQLLALTLNINFIFKTYGPNLIFEVVMVDLYMTKIMILIRRSSVHVNAIQGFLKSMSFNTAEWNHWYVKPSNCLGTVQLQSDDAFLRLSTWCFTLYQSLLLVTAIIKSTFWNIFIFFLWWDRITPGIFQFLHY